MANPVLTIHMLLTQAWQPGEARTHSAVGRERFSEEETFELSPQGWEGVPGGGNSKGKGLEARPGPLGELQVCFMPREELRQLSPLWFILAASLRVGPQC